MIKIGSYVKLKGQKGMGRPKMWEVKSLDNYPTSIVLESKSRKKEVKVVSIKDIELYYIRNDSGTQLNLNLNDVYDQVNKVDYSNDDYPEYETTKL